MNKKMKVLLIFAFACYLSSYVFAEKATVTYVRGKVEVQKEGGKWYSLSVGDIINQNETISTGFSSEAKIEYNSSIMAIGALSRCTLENLSSSTNKDDISIYLKVGALRSKVNHTKEKRVSYVVKTPVAVASVRGTDFTVAASGTITCNEGAVVVFPNIERYVSTNTQQVESEKSEAEEDELAGDYETANSVTPANEILENAPLGSVVVAQYQTVSITDLGTTETPIINATNKTQQAKTVVATAADKEVEVLASSSEHEIASTDNSNAIDNISNKAKLLLEFELNN